MSGFSFGVAPNVNVGGTTVPQNTFAFGSGTSFGNPVTSSLATAPSTGLPTFGTPATGTNISFGGLGSTSVPSFGSNTGAPTFGTSSAASPFGPITSTFGGSTGTGLAFPTPATSTGFGLGTNTTTSLPLSFGGGGATTTTSSGFSFTAPTSTTAPAFGIGGFSATPQTSLSTGFGGATGTSTMSGFGLGGQVTTGFGSQLNANKPTLSLGMPPTTTSAPFVGLGGVDINVSSIGGQAGANIEPTSEKAAKDNIVPPEIMQQFEEFKEFVKQQKSISSEFSRASTKPFHRIQVDIKSVSHQLDCIQNQIQTYSAGAKKLRHDCAKSLQHAEMAQQTYDTPSNFQLEFFAPDEYFAEVTSNIEQELYIFRNEIENVEKLLSQVSDASTIKNDALVLGLKHIHSIFMALASRMQTLHNAVEQQKESCLSMRRHYLHDNTDIFEHLSALQQVSNKEKSSARSSNICGPPLFSSSSTPSTSFGSTGSQQLAAANARLGFPTSLNFGVGQTSSILGGSPSVSFSSSSDAAENRPFQLQQPPVGNKRGKR